MSENAMMSMEAVNTSLNSQYDNSVFGDWYSCKPLLNAVYHYWPQTCYHTYSENKFEQAFKVLTKLIEKKVVEVNTVKKFIETLGEIQSVL